MKDVEIYIRWLRQDEEMLYRTRRFPCCTICRDKGIFTTARAMNDDIPVCEAHCVKEEIDLKNLDLTIDDV